MESYDNIKIIVDTREQQPWDFEFNETAIAKLDTGDYSVDGLEDILCIERKESVSELAGNCGEKRFLRELKAMSSFPHAFLLLEFVWHQIEQYPVGSTVPKSKWKDIRIKGKYIMRVLTSAQIEQGIHVIACGDSKRAEEIAFRIMRHVNDL